MLDYVSTNTAADMSGPTHRYLCETVQRVERAMSEGFRVLIYVTIQTMESPSKVMPMYQSVTDFAASVGSFASCCCVSSGSLNVK